jgi:hypothetical protein
MWEKYSAGCAVCVLMQAWISCGVRVVIAMYAVLGWGWRADHMAQLIAFFCASGLCGWEAMEVPFQGAL